MKPGALKKSKGGTTGRSRSIVQSFQQISFETSQKTQVSLMKSFILGVSDVVEICINVINQI